MIRAKLEEITESLGRKDLKDHPVWNNPSFPGESVFPWVSSCVLWCYPWKFFLLGVEMIQNKLSLGFGTKGQEKTLGQFLTV